MFKKLNASFKEKINRGLLITSFIIYIIIVLWIIFFKCTIPYFTHPNKGILSLSILEAFKKTFFLLILKTKIYLTFIDAICNLLILIPLGLYLCVLFKRKNFLRDFLITLFFVICIETTELFTRLGQFNFFDIIFNVSGMMIGEFIFYKLQKKLSVQVINYIQLFVVIIFLPLAVYALISVPLNWNIYAPIFDYEKYPYILY